MMVMLGESSESAHIQNITRKVAIMEIVRVMARSWSWIMVKHDFIYLKLNLINNIRNNEINICALLWPSKALMNGASMQHHRKAWKLFMQVWKFTFSLCLW